MIIGGDSSEVLLSVNLQIKKGGINFWVCTRTVILRSGSCNTFVSWLYWFLTLNENLTLKFEIDKIDKSTFHLKTVVWNQ